MQQLPSSLLYAAAFSAKQVRIKFAILNKKITALWGLSDRNVIMPDQPLLPHYIGTIGNLA